LTEARPGRYRASRRDCSRGPGDDVDRCCPAGRSMPKRRATMRQTTRFIGAIGMAAWTATSAAAQPVTVDLDQLSKIAYCLGWARQGLAWSVSQQSFCTTPAHPQDEQWYAKLCANEQKSQKDLRSKIFRFNAYVISRLIVSTNADLAVRSAEDAGESDLRSCLAEVDSLDSGSGICSFQRFNGPDKVEKQQACVDQNKPAACERVAVCATRELPR
jgi:hypothetical protein